MYRSLLALGAFVALVACGDGNPFDTVPGDGDGDGTASDIPASIASNVTAFAYNPSAGTLTLTGTLRDEDELTTTFRRRPALDRGVYQAFTAQDDPLDEHTTVYVREVGDVSGAVAVTGGQFTYYSGGVNYGRAGGFQPVPASEANDTGLVTYAGQYIGLSNVNGPDTDLATVPGGVGNAVIPSQAATVTGRIFVNVSFDDQNLAGTIYERRLDTVGGTLAVPDLVLVPTELAENGTFSGDIEVRGDRNDRGDYAGTIGANQGQAMAGGIFASGHFGDGSSDVEEYGVFVLGRCNGPVADPSPECDAVE
jgi:hypothetical protein